jgi:hypothetical protein
MLGASSAAKNLMDEQVRKAAAADPPVTVASQRRSVLGHRLQRPVGPAHALAPQSAQRRGRLGMCNGVCHRAGRRARRVAWRSRVERSPVRQRSQPVQAGFGSRHASVIRRLCFGLI